MFDGISPSKSGDFPLTESPWVDGINVQIPYPLVMSKIAIENGDL
jgi:hypothetical protein